MRIICIEIIKTIDETEPQKQNKNKQKTNKKNKHWKGQREGAEAIVKGWELNDFVVHLS